MADTGATKRPFGPGAPNWRPPSGYKWDQFKEGNEANLRHGADSERRIRPLADRLAADAVEQAPWLVRPAFAASLAAWARAEARALLIDEYLDRHGLLDADGVPRPAATYADRLEVRAAALRGQLGLDPMSFAKLLATFSGTPGAADVLEALTAEGREVMTARAERLALEPLEVDR